MFGHGGVPLHIDMTREQWLRIKSIVSDAWEQPDSQRTTFIAEACEGDASLRREVEGLLRSTIAAAALYETPAIALAGGAAAVKEATRRRPPLLDARVGHYQIIRELGHGGMGSVYLAERADGEFDQQVAIKFVSGVPSEALLRRFREERRILAALNHPNIATLLDGGTTGDGLPYVTMEYVDGVPIDRVTATVTRSGFEGGSRCFARHAPRSTTRISGS